MVLVLVIGKLERAASTGNGQQDRSDFSELSTAPCWAAKWGQIAGMASGQSLDKDKRPGHSSHQRSFTYG